MSISERSDRFTNELEAIGAETSPLDTAAAFLRCIFDTKAAHVVTLALDVTERWFERPHDAVIWASAQRLARQGTNPAVTVVQADLRSRGQLTREVQHRLLALAVEPFQALPGQLAPLRRALAAEAFARRFEEGTRALHEDAPRMTQAEKARRYAELGRELRALDNASQSRSASPSLTEVPA
ncbi:hypothetical protein HT102_03360 [Hoyosella sp. G463]|uniref:Uncharacterized protein n=1 Tax=Lolliginicoccus lacisalsi TaxID=2742202 RepID=A0A927JAC3_9ACTN|nr:hypothetical protein [Lolliginicoccus lacisalsi]MBD8505529.1 hypothetical protein [Lolliginicoccus lacisalsi]